MDAEVEEGVARGVKDHVRRPLRRLFQITAGTRDLQEATHIVRVARQGDRTKAMGTLREEFEVDGAEGKVGVDVGSDRADAAGIADPVRLR